MPRIQNRGFFETFIEVPKPDINVNIIDPLKLLGLINRHQWQSFGLAVLVWAWDSFDFFSVSLVIPELGDTFNKTHEDIVWTGLTLPLTSRFFGAGVFGLAADKYGRKWPLILNIFILCAFELGTGFAPTYKGFIAFRVLFGFAMGGLYGNSAATALEDCPKESRGLISGMFQSGYPLGFLLSTVFKFALVRDADPETWRRLFKFGAGPPLLLVVWRLLLSETTAFSKNRRRKQPDVEVLVGEAGDALGNHWKVIIYLSTLIAGLSSISHGSQDLFPLLLHDNYGFSSGKITLVQVTSTLGAILGSIVCGYSSQIVGRRFALLITLIFGAILLYPYTHTSSDGIFAAVFFEQFFVQGAFGIVPILLVELAPPSHRVFVVGFSYQLGLLVSSSVDAIEESIGRNYPLPPLENALSTKRFDFGKVMGIYIGCVYVFAILVAVLLPERRGASLVRGEEEEYVFHII